MQGFDYSKLKAVERSAKDNIRDSYALDGNNNAAQNAHQVAVDDANSSSL